MLDYIAISELLSHRLDDLINHFGLNLTYSHSQYRGCCPFHKGDNTTAFVILNNGTWRCFTRHCEEIYIGTAIGFVRACLSIGKTKVSIGETLDFIKHYLSHNLESVKVDVEEAEKRQFIQAWTGQDVRGTQLTKKQVRQELVIPATYYLNRGYSPHILNKFDVGLCVDQTKEMFNRVVVPIYDEREEYLLACTGRNPYEKCPKCDKYHNPDNNCPQIYSKQYAKWVHSTGCRTGQYLYNYWNAKEHIRDSGVAIITEGPGEVWRLEESGIFNSVSIFGTELSNEQILMLSKAGTLSLVVLTNNDKAGFEAAKRIQSKCSRLFRLYFPTISANDIGSLNIDEVTRDVRPFLDEICRLEQY